MSALGNLYDVSAPSRADSLALLQQALSRFSATLPEDLRPVLDEKMRVLLEQSTTADLQRAVQQLCRSVANWGYHPPTALGRALNHIMCEFSLTQDSAVEGAANLAAVVGRPVLLVSNHLSYSDAHVVQGLLYRAGLHAASERLTVIAGPKVFDDPVRRVTGSSFGMIKTPQSHGVVANHEVQSASAADHASLSPRELATYARQSIDCAAERLALGDTLLLFPEGTRSRTLSMQAGLPAVARYFEVDGCVLVPLALMGSQQVMALGDDRLRAARVVLRIGVPIEIADLERRCAGKRKAMVDAACEAIAALLEPQYRGVYESPARA